MSSLRKWIYQTVNKMSNKDIKSIVSNHHYLSSFITAFSG